jgi:membrane-associated protein
MEYLKKFADIILHLDKYLDQLVAQFGPWVYLILFAIVFCETGLVVTPFLPGDSLLFAVGAIAARPDGLNVWVVIGLLIAAAFLGDNVNYWFGHYVGPKVFKQDRKWLNRKHLDRTHEFYERYGLKTIIIARFVPIVRTFAPFVAGLGRMPYSKFIGFSVAGTLLWVFSMTFAGYFFGGIEIVKKNFSIVVLMIIVISLLPAIIGFLQERRTPARAPKA